jgi:hypothetical protein
MSKPKSVIGWKLDRAERAELLTRFPPRYADTVADHVTLQADAEGRSLPQPADAEIVGRADDGDSLECLVVAIDGTTARPDGSVFHITWSLDKASGRKARESNDVLREQGWTAIEEPVPINLDPARFQ